LQASVVVPKIMTSVMDKMARLLLSRLVPGEEPVTLVSDYMNMTLASNAPDKLLSASLVQGDAMLTADWCSIAPPDIDCTSSEPISIKVCAVLGQLHQPVIVSGLTSSNECMQCESKNPP